MRFRQRTQHGDVGVRTQQRGRGRAVGEFAVGLVHHHQRVAFQRVRQGPDAVQRDGRTRRIGGRAQEHQLGPLTERRLADGVEIGDEPGVAIDQRHLDDACALQACADHVHAEHRRRHHDGVLSGHAQRAHQQVDGLVAAAPDQQLLRRHAINLRQARAKRGWLRIRIAAAATLPVGRIGPRRFVGVQPHLATQGFAAGRLVAREIAQVRTHQGQDAAHAAALRNRSATAWACAPSPSARASVKAQSPMAAMPARLADCTLTKFWKLDTLTPL